MNRLQPVAHRGRTAYHAGLAAEDSVSQLYDRSGRPIIARRWRGSVGEIDLTARQAQRIMATASEFVGGEPRGQLTDIRFDVALVDAAGRIEIIENALAA